MSTSGCRLRSAHVVVTMKKLGQFTSRDLADALDINENAASRWVAEFREHRLLTSPGVVQRNPSGIKPRLWQWVP